MIHIPSLIDDAKCFEAVRALRWPNGVCCPRCNSLQRQSTRRNKDDVHQMTSQLRQDILLKKPSPTLTDEGECDEVSIVAGHKGKPDAVEKKAARPARTTQGKTRTRHTRNGKATSLRDDPAQWRGGDSDAGKRPTTDDEAAAMGTCVYTDEYSIYSRLEQGGYAHKSVWHSRGE